MKSAIPLCFLKISLVFLQNNASNDGEYVFFTGQQNYMDFAKVDTWNGERLLSLLTSNTK